MKYIDIHSHLDHDRFKEDLDKVIARCRRNEVGVICSGVNPVTNNIALNLKEKYPDVVSVSFGLYPLDALGFEINSGEEGFQRKIETFSLDKELNFLKESKEKFVAVGEIGLDYNFEEIRNSDELKEKQKENFKKILIVAKEIELPVIVHTRKAEQDCLDILEEVGNKKVVLHCFQGKKSLIKRAVELGFYFSVPPVIKRLEHFKMLVDIVPLDKLLTETDSPYLSSERGVRNEPVNVIVSIEEMAKIKGLDVESVRKKILENARIVFDVI